MIVCGSKNDRAAGIKDGSTNETGGNMVLTLSLLLRSASVAIAVAWEKMVLSLSIRYQHI